MGNKLQDRTVFRTVKRKLQQLGIDATETMWSLHAIPGQANVKRSALRIQTMGDPL